MIVVGVVKVSEFKMYNQKFNYTAISRESVDGKRHYCLPDGSKVPSVTTILDATKSQEKRDSLQRWRKSVGEDRAQQIVTEAANRGTRMHKWLENYVKDGVLGEPGSNPYSKQSHSMAKQIVEKALLKVDEFWGVEVPLYCSGLYAGTTDCVAVWEGKPAILDFKQTNKPKKREWIEDYFLQLSAYALAHNETHGTSINQGIILMCSADGEYQQFDISGTEMQEWTEKWLKRVEQYYRLL